MGEKPKSIEGLHLTIDNKKMSDPKLISKEFADAFVCKTDDSKEDLETFKSTINIQNSPLDPFTPEEVESNFKTLKPTEPRTKNEIPYKVYKNVFPVLAIPLALIFSQFLSLGAFPDNLKIATISPIYKGKGIIPLVIGLYQCFHS